MLVAYGTKHGSTKKVAEAITENLKHAGRDVELRRAADVEDLTRCDGVVLGGSLYFGRWHGTQFASYRSTDVSCREAWTDEIRRTT